MNSHYKIQKNSVKNIVEDFNNNCVGCNKCQCLMMGDLNIDMKSFTSKVLKDGLKKKQAFSCVDCMQCNTKCDLDINEIFRVLKNDIYCQLENNKLFNTPYILQKQVKKHHKINKPKSKTVFMSGCTLNSKPKLVNKALEILKTHDKQIELFDGCCTKPIKLLGNEKLHQKYLNEYKEKFKDTVVITACFSCTKVLENFVETTTLYEYTLNNNLITKKSFNQDYSIKLPCHINDYHTNICLDVCKTLGVNVISTDNTCCGSGGLIGFSNYKLSRKYLNCSINNLKTNSAICFCAECNSKINKKKKSRHIIELL